MKILIVLLATITIGFSQTNLGFVQFTNRFGLLVEGDVVRADPIKIQVKQNGVINSVKLADAPKEIQTRFGFDEQAAHTAKTNSAASLRKYDAARREAVSNAVDAYEKLQKRRAMETNMVILNARVIQRDGDQILADCSGSGGGRNWRGYEPSKAYIAWVKANGPTAEYKFTRERNTVLIVDFPGNPVDDDGLILVAYPFGTFSYTAVSGGKKTVRRYTCDIEKAMNYTEEYR